MKKKMLIGMFLIFKLLSLCVYGQDAIEKNELNTKSTEKVEKPNAIFFAPLNLFDFGNPNIQIGYERFVSKKWALQIEGGLIINHSIINSVIDLANGIKIKECLHTNEGFRFRGSIKYVLVDKRKFKLYVSPELFYLKNKSRVRRDFLVSDTDFEYSFDLPEWMLNDDRYANVYNILFYNDEEKMGINFKAGIKLLMGKRFFMEPHFGIGFAHRNVIQTDIENPNDKIYDDLFGIFEKTAPNKWVPTLPFNFKIGFRF